MSMTGDAPTPPEAEVATLQNAQRCRLLAVIHVYSGVLVFPFHIRNIKVHSQAGHVVYVQRNVVLLYVVPPFRF
jgi:hypothetical protein